MSKAKELLEMLGDGTCKMKSISIDKQFLHFIKDLGVDYNLNGDNIDFQINSSLMDLASSKGIEYPEGLEEM